MKVCCCRRSGAWLAKENRARIDDVVDFLKNASDSEQYAGSPTIRSRLDEMIVLLTSTLPTHLRPVF